MTATAARPTTHPTAGDIIATGEVQIPSNRTGDLGRLTRAALRRQRIGRAWWTLPLGGALMATMTDIGYINLGEELGTDATTVSSDAIRSWMMVLLFAAIFGAVTYTREIASGTVSREAGFHPNRTQLFWSRTIAAGITGTLFGLFAIGAGLGITRLLFETSTQSFVFTRDVALTMLGIVICCTLSGLLGLYTGMLTRSTALAVGLIIFFILLFDPALQRLVPSVGKLLFSIALSSVYRDTRPELLSMGWGVVVAGIWIAALGWFTHRAFTTRDLA